MPFLTSDTGQVLWLVNLSLTAGIPVNVVYLAYDPPWVRSLGDLATTGIGPAVAIRVWQVFPFDLSPRLVSGGGVAPHHKVTIVQALTVRGHVVAMTGDGVNDAAALHAAHRRGNGVTGTDVAKEAAAMVLTDDDFSTIVRAIRQGRAIYDNVVTPSCGSSCPPTSARSWPCWPRRCSGCPPR
jgi:Ca2+-transporting ATPase